LSNAEHNDIQIVSNPNKKWCLCDLCGLSLRSLRLKAFDRKVREGLAKIAKS